MEIHFWGTRGSVPIGGSRCVRHGGATTCLTVENDDGLWVIDCGTGIVEAGRTIGALEFTVLQTHLHWDHIQGFPFFDPIFDPRRTIDFWAVPREGQTMRDALVTQMSQPTFPVPIDVAPATLRFTDIARTGEATTGGTSIRWDEVTHPAGCSAYRFDSPQGVFVFTADVEAPDCFDTLVAHCEGADVMVMDAQYFPDEYTTRKGWGHSTYEHAVDVAVAAGVGSLYLTHHDPSHDDERLAQKLDAARRYAAGRVAVDNAYDGLRLSLGRAVDVAA